MGTIEINTTTILPLPGWGLPLLRLLYQHSEDGVLEKDRLLDEEIMIMLKIDRSTIWKYFERLKKLKLVSNYPGRQRGKYVLDEQVLDWFS